jgi:glycosyltransferase involved in cell wall biosynthesis
VRILVVSNLYPPIVAGGYEVECATVVQRLRDRHDVTVLASRHRAGEAPSQPGVRRELALLEASWRGTLRAPAAALHGAEAMRRALAATAPDLVYVWNGSQLPGAALRVALDSGRPVAFRICEAWFRGLFTGPDGDQFLRHVAGTTGRRRLLDPVARTVNRHPRLRLDPDRRSPAAVCWNARALQERVGMPPAVRPVLETVLHSVAVRGPVFAAAPRRPAEGPPLIAYVGRVDRLKGADVAIRALGRLRREPDLAQARLVLAGPPDPGFDGELRAAMAAWDVPPSAVERPGPLPAEDVVGLLARAHAFVVPSNWFEPFPQVLIEGAFARVPMVAAAVGGIPECFQDPDHLLLFEGGDDAGCAAALARVLREPEAAARRVAAARERAEAEFGLEAYLDATEGFVDEALAALRS